MFQKCNLSASQWLAGVAHYTLDEIHGLEGEINDPILDKQQGQWELLPPVNYRVFKVSWWYDYYQIEYTLKFRRTPTFYVVVLIVPSILLAILPLLGFLIPIDCGEKISLGVTVLLAQG